MTFKAQIEGILREVFEEYNSLFLIDLSLSTDYKIRVIIDGDEGVSLDDCIKVSRYVEHRLDREKIDFSLEVMSPGATEPIQHQRQYKKHIGRKLEVDTQQHDKLEGVLTQVNAEGIKLEWKAREPKPIGKGKVTVLKEKQLLFPDILRARVKIKF